MQVEDGATLGDLVATLGLTDEQRITFVNGRHACDEQLLAEGDRVAIFPPVAGG